MAASNTVGLVFVVGGVFVAIKALDLIRGGPSAKAASTGTGSGSSGGSTSTVPAVEMRTDEETALRWAQDNGVDPLFLFSLIDHESSWSRGAKDPASNSWGPLQLNLSAHPGVSKACAEDMACSLNYWGGHIKSEYERLGGNNAFHANPLGFLQTNVPIIQGSIAWTAAMAQQAYADAQAELRTVSG